MEGDIRRVDGATHIDLLHAMLLVPQQRSCRLRRPRPTLSAMLQDIPGEHEQGLGKRTIGFSYRSLGGKNYISSHFELNALEPNEMRHMDVR